MYWTGRAVRNAPAEGKGLRGVGEDLSQGEDLPGTVLLSAKVLTDKPMGKVPMGRGDWSFLRRRRAYRWEGGPYRFLRRSALAGARDDDQRSPSRLFSLAGLTPLTCPSRSPLSLFPASTMARISVRELISVLAAGQLGMRQARIPQAVASRQRGRKEAVLPVPAERPAPDHDGGLFLRSPVSPMPRRHLRPAEAALGRWLPACSRPRCRKNRNCARLRALSR
jgi:hypothetical protein